MPLHQQHAASREKVPVEMALVLIDAAASCPPSLRVEKESRIREPFFGKGSLSERRSRVTCGNLETVASRIPKE